MRIRLTSITSYSILLGFLCTAHATQVSPTDLRASHWQSIAAANDAPTTPCNYLYIDNSNNLLYYGTAQNCRTRLKQHANAADQSGIGLMKEALSFLPETGNNSQKYVLSQMRKWTVSMDDNGRTENNGTSDVCLGINHLYSPIGMWYLSLPSRANAAAVETEVLSNTVGFCNRRGQGNTKGSWMYFMGVLQKATKNATH